jgi:ABC-type transport system substrate-binding protein
MMNKKAIARNIAILYLIIIILAASVIGVVLYVVTLPPTPTVKPLPGEFELSDLTVSPSSVTIGEDVTISVDVTNTGETSVTGTVTLILNGVYEAEDTVTVAANETKTVTFTVAKSVVALYTVTIPGTTLTDTFTVSGGVPAFVTNNELILETDDTFQWMDPHVTYYAFDIWVLWHSVETLLWYERDNATKIIPWLAESYTVSDDGLQYNFTLRQGITFQD